MNEVHREGPPDEKPHKGMVTSRSGRAAGKVALVTGGSLGIGRACAELLAAHGASVAVTDILDSEGQTVVNLINEMGGTAAFWDLDVRNEQHVALVMQKVVERFGRIDILVNNAGIAGVNKPTHEIEEAEWEALMAVNVKGVFFCTKHAVRQMMRRKSGSIINLSSIYGLVGAADSPPYHASKGAVRLMSKTDALLYAPHGIRVNSVHPGFIETPMVEGFLDTMGERAASVRRQLVSLHPLGRIGSAEDVAYGVLYLASDESKFVTGTELVIDGGYTAR